ncbi:MAG: zinc ABC transporter substrate-binding protein [Planctomycetales bacterium]|nr:zinc ABC transporter substrate-binding protein [Planctomycetales bacterium]
MYIKNPMMFLPGLLLSSAILAGCNNADNHSVSTDEAGSASRGFTGHYPIQIVCTIGQVAEMVAQIGGEHVHVDALMGPGVDPHLYRPISSDVSKLSKADAIFFNGLHLEGRMSDLFVQMARNKATFAVTEGLQSRSDSRLREPPEFEGMFDPHVWHDVKLWADCVADVAKMLSEFDPSHANDYQENANAYADQLNKLDQFCKDEIAKIPENRRVLVTAHDAFGYFGKAYGLDVFGLKGISTDSEKDIAHQETIQNMIIQRKIPAVFVESAIAPRTVEALVEPCRDAGHDLKIGGELYADALGPAGTDESSYLGMIRHNVKTIVQALSTEIGN